jgi:hypothetical protein
MMVLGFVALAVLIGLAFVSIKRQREKVSYEKQQAEYRAHVGDEQHERSMHSRAAVRAGRVQPGD